LAIGGPRAGGDDGGREADLGRDDGVSPEMAQIDVRVRHVEVGGLMRVHIDTIGDDIFSSTNDRLI
jgi:hypothetical protein